MSFLAPKPSTESNVSQNVNNPLITSAYGGMVGNGTQANNFLTSLLTGQGDTSGANAGYQNYLQMAGYQPAMTQLSRGVTGQGAAAGILNSGATAQALETKGTQLNNQFYNNYLQQLSGASGLGLQAGGLIANTGQQSHQQTTGAQSSTFGNIMSGVGGIASIFSDRRLKSNVEKIGEEPDGLGIYRFRYIGALRDAIGVMADEVAALRPWAIGRTIAGYQTVNYGAL